jgi:hypothetical protein
MQSGRPLKTLLRSLLGLITFASLCMAQTSTVVTFDNPAPPGSPDSLLNGIFQGIDFGTSQWRWSGPYGVDPTNSVYFASSSGTSRAFTFSPAPRLLNSINVYTTANGTLTLTDGVNPPITRTITIGSMQLVSTGWILGSTTVTVTFSAGWSLGAGIVVSKFFENNVGHSSGIVLTRLFGSPVNTHEKLVKYDHLSLKYYASSNSASAGDQINLTIEVSLNDEVHLYAPGVKDYSPISWELGSSSAFSSQQVHYPLPKIISLPSMHEHVNVYQGAFQISRKITINPENRELLSMTDTDGNLVVNGTFHFQACDDKICYVPRKIPLEWKLTTIPFK